MTSQIANPSGGQAKGVHPSGKQTIVSATASIDNSSRVNDDLASRIDCDHCHGGWLIEGNEARRCACGRAFRATAKSIIPRRYWAKNLYSLTSNHLGDKDRQRLGLAIKAGINYSAGLLQGHRGSLYFFGGCGAGKSHIGWGIVREFILEKGCGVYARSFSDVCADIRASYSDNSLVSERRIRLDILRADLVFLDDIGVDSGDFANSKLLEILEARLLEVQPTILTSNIPPSSMAKVFGERVTSRICELAEFVDLGGMPDFRMVSVRR